MLVGMAYVPAVAPYVVNDNDPLLDIVASPYIDCVAHSVPEPISKLPAVAVVEPKLVPFNPVVIRVPEVDIVASPDIAFDTH